MVTHVWIVNDQGQLLIQKQQRWKKGRPNMWAGVIEGAAQIGDTSIAAITGIREEIGVDLDISEGELLFAVKSGISFDHIWLFKHNLDIKELKLQHSEGVEAKWASEAEISEMVTNGEFVKVHYLNRLFELIKSRISLKRAVVDDAQQLLELQKQVFADIYDRYQDHETSPVNQSLDRFLKRFEIGDYYKVLFDNKLAGSVFVYEKEPGQMVFHIINILRDYQNKGIAQEVMIRLEGIYPQAVSWELDTIQSEKRNCYLYEKMGYRQTGETRVINEKMTLVKYIKTQGFFCI